MEPNDGIKHWTDLASPNWLAEQEESMVRELWVYETIGDYVDTSIEPIKLDKEESELFTQTFLTLDKNNNEESSHTSTWIQRRRRGS
jgi:hypothetical protein